MYVNEDGEMLPAEVQELQVQEEEVDDEVEQQMDEMEEGQE